MPRAWEADFLRNEFWLAIAAATALAAWMFLLGGEAHVDNILHGQRTAVYGSLAAIFGALLGFIITAFSIIIGFSQDGRFDVVFRSKHADDLWATFTSAIRAHGIATLVVLVALVADTDQTPRRWAVVAVIFATVYAALRLVRVVWIIEQMVVLLRPKPPGEAAR